MRRNLIRSFEPVRRRSGVTARHASKKINAHEPVKRVIVSIGLTPRLPVYALKASWPKGIKQAKKRRKWTIENGEWKMVETRLPFVFEFPFSILNYPFSIQ